MKYFIHSVQTYLASGKSRKGALLQAVASRFEQTIIDEKALAELICKLRKLVVAVNKKYKGKPLFVSTGDGWICVKPEYNGNDNHVFAINFKPVEDVLSADEVGDRVYETILNLDWELADQYTKGGEA